MAPGVRLSLTGAGVEVLFSCLLGQTPEGYPDFSGLLCAMGDSSVTLIRSGKRYMYVIFFLLRYNMYIKYTNFM